jgi:hypothetical protein
MALPTLYTPPKNSEELEKRKILASALKDFAAGSSPETAESLTSQGEKIGVTRNQLSNLYNQYKKQGVTATPLSAGPEMFGPPATLAGAPATSPVPEIKKPQQSLASADLYEESNGMGSVSIGATGVQGATGGLSRGTSRIGGTPIGRGSKKDRMGDIATNLLMNAYKERQRENAALKAEEDAYNRIYSMQPKPL